MSKLKPAPKASIKKNVWDNWYGYHGCKKVTMFFGWQEREANEWLAAQAAKGFRTEGVKPDSSFLPNAPI